MVTSGVLMGDGSLVSTQLYAVMDIGWALAVIDFIKLQIHLEDKADFITTPNTVSIDNTTKPSLSIAVMGDWVLENYQDGPSPDSPSTQVMSAIRT